MYGSCSMYRIVPYIVLWRTEIRFSTKLNSNFPTIFTHDIPTAGYSFSSCLTAFSITGYENFSWTFICNKLFTFCPVLLTRSHYFFYISVLVTESLKRLSVICHIWIARWGNATPTLSDTLGLYNISQTDRKLSYHK